MHILVTGGAGTLGRTDVPKLTGAGHVVRVAGHVLHVSIVGRRSPRHALHAVQARRRADRVACLDDVSVACTMRPAGWAVK
jgi:nucleoside-diphosphate-sugar epimerase